MQNNLPAEAVGRTLFKLLGSIGFRRSLGLPLPAFCRNLPAFPQIAGRDGFVPDCILSQLISLRFLLFSVHDYQPSRERSREIFVRVLISRLVAVQLRDRVTSNLACLGNFSVRCVRLSCGSVLVIVSPD